MNRNLFRLFVFGCLMLTSLRAGTEVLLYPFARAFGAPSEAELETCRVGFRQLQGCLETCRVQVAPVLVSDEGRCTWRTDLSDVFVRELAQRSSLKAEASALQPAVEPPKMGHNQMRYLWKRADVYAAWVKTKAPTGDYVFCAEILGAKGKVYAIQFYLFDAQGQLVYCRLLNSHHFGNALPLAREHAVRLIVRTFVENLTWKAEKLFPPYGVG